MLLLDLNLMKTKIILEKYPEELKDVDNICGVDEAGRGALSGPVFAASVILPKDFESELIRDSKKLSEKKRLEAFSLIKEKAVSWSYSYVNPEDIDKYNIQNATFSAMYGALIKLDPQPEHILVDGNVFEDYYEVPHTCVVKGDDKYLPIAAASIVAKVLRDEYMTNIDKTFPEYKWKSNKGYGSKEHIEKILKEGTTYYHRKSFLKKILN